MSRFWGFDTSWWQIEEQITPAIMAEFYDQGCRFAIVRFSGGRWRDARAASHVAAIRTTPMALGGYHWTDPTANPETQINNYLAPAIQEFRPDFISLDYEQWWSDWSKFDLASQGKIPWSQVPAFSPAHLAAHGLRAQLASERCFDGLNIPYTGAWYLRWYAPGMAAWMADRPSWIAAHLPAENPKTKIVYLPAWANFHTRLARLTQPHSTVPARGGWSIWQITGGYVLPPYRSQWHKLDINVWNGTEEEMRAAIAAGGAFDPLPELPPNPAPESYQVKPWWLTVRKGASSSYPGVAWLPMGTPVSVYWEMAGWGRIDPVQERWVAMSQLERV